MSENPNSRAKSETGELKIRIKGIHKDIWIDCPQSRKALRSIVAVIEVPERTTAPCILISGPGGMGKTTIVNQLRKKNRSLGSPFVFLSLAENPSNLKFKQLILEALVYCLKNKCSVKSSML
ncbi:TniB family NTP-binding protein, partial [Pseudomonas syringae pv. actinidiae]|nr:TniB family NTP-binding protein [Pseudomonas syringae pv. actinidiae]